MEKISDFCTRLEEGLSARNTSAAQLSRDTGISKGTLSQYLKGVFKPKHEALYRMAEVLSVNIQWLEGYDVPMENPYDESALCSLPVFSIGDLSSPLRHEPCTAEYMDCFYVEGDDHLYPAVNVGDLVLIEKVHRPDDSQAVLAAFRQYRGLYIYKLCSQGVMLCCLNPYYPPVSIRGDELSELEIMGRVVLSIRKWNN